MPFRSKQQMKACFASNGFNGKIDCHKWAHETPNIKKLPMKKKSYGGKIDHSRRKCMNCGGKMQGGGSYGIPKREDYPDQESYENALEEYYVGPSVNTRTRSYAPINMPQQAPITQSDFLPEEAAPLTSSTPNLGVLEPKRVDDIDVQANQMYAAGDKQYQQGYDKDLGMSVMDNGTASERRSYRNFYRGKYGEGINPVDPFQVGLGVVGLKGVFSWLGEKKNRRAQNRYMYNQYSTLGQNDAVPVSNFQPTPYNLYAKLGGNLKRYMFTNNAENKNFPVDAGKMQQGGILRKQLQQFIQPTPSVYGVNSEQPQFTPNYNLNQIYKRNWGPSTDTSLYDIDFEAMINSEPYALKNKRDFEKYGAGSIDSKDAVRGMVWNTENAYEDALRQKAAAAYNMYSITPISRKPMKKGGRWIQSAVNPEHKGYCTPMTKSTCTGRRRALALTFKKHHGFHKKK